jgi:hypothetical protein
MHKYLTCGFCVLMALINVPLMLTGDALSFVAFIFCLGCAFGVMGLVKNTINPRK